jgi:NADH:ubiquinone oxidoreductase subunit
MSLFSEIFIWWGHQTLGTRFYTWRKGEHVGSDDLGNVYYRERRGHRRWVIYANLAEASHVPARWHAWLHKIVDEVPSATTGHEHPWQKPHQPNMTGSQLAHRPPGSSLATGSRPTATGDYQAWTPADR